MPSNFGERVADARRRLGVRTGKDLLPAWLAAEMGVVSSTVYSWEKNEKRPRDGRLDALAELLGVTPWYLLYGEQPTEHGTAMGRIMNRAGEALDTKKASGKAGRGKRAG